MKKGYLTTVLAVLLALSVALNVYFLVRRETPLSPSSGPQDDPAPSVAAPTETEDATLQTLPVPTETEDAALQTVPAPTDVPEPTFDAQKYEAMLGMAQENRNWIAASIGCLFDTPEQIDLEYLFYLGVEGGSWADISPESQQALVDQGFMRELDLQVMPVQVLEDILQANFGVSLSQMQIPEAWGYIEAEDAYCSNNSDAYFVLPSEILSAQEAEDGTVAITYQVDGYLNTDTDEYYDTAVLTLTLKENGDGWLILSNKFAE